MKVLLAGMDVVGRGGGGFWGEERSWMDRIEFCREEGRGGGETGRE